MNHDLCIIRQPEAPQRPVDVVVWVHRQHCQVITGAVLRAFRQRDLDVALRAGIRHGHVHQLAVFNDRAYLEVILAQQRVARPLNKFDLEERHGRGRARFLPERSPDLLPEVGVPAVEVTEKVAARIGLAAINQALGTSLGQLQVDLLWEWPGRCAPSLYCRSQTRRTLRR